eukprot:SAG31_NODE_3176_length_4586_cov_2.717406_1_plen_296_part_00
MYQDQGAPFAGLRWSVLPAVPACATPCRRIEYREEMTSSTMTSTRGWRRLRAVQYHVATTWQLPAAGPPTPHDPDFAPHTAVPRFEAGDPQAAAYLEAHGFCALKQVLTAAEVERTLGLLWEFLEQQGTGVQRGKPATWGDADWSPSGGNGGQYAVRDALRKCSPAMFRIQNRDTRTIRNHRGVGVPVLNSRDIASPLHLNSVIHAQGCTPVTASRRAPLAGTCARSRASSGFGRVSSTWKTTRSLPPSMGALCSGRVASIRDGGSVVGISTLMGGEGTAGSTRGDGSTAKVLST